MNGDLVTSLWHDVTTMLLVVIIYSQTRGQFSEVRGHPVFVFYELNAVISKVYVIVLRCVSFGLGLQPACHRKIKKDCQHPKTP